MVENFQLLIILLCMAGEAFFSGMETGVISIHRMRLRHFVRRRSKGARILQDFLHESDRLFGVTLVGTNICVVVTSVVSASMAVRMLGAYGELVSTVVITVLVLVFCEYIPKAWFHSRPFERCQRYAGALRFAEIVLRPISLLVIGITRLMVPGPKKSFSKPSPFVTREDLKVLAHEGERDGVLSPEERQMIHSVFELSRKRAREIMIPRKNMVYVHTETTLDEFFKIVKKSGFTRLPVYDEEAKEFTGMINVFVVLSSRVNGNRQKPVKNFIRRPLFIPEDMPVDDIFPKLRRAHQPMCLVRDAEKNVSGLITTEDILDEIIGHP